MLQITMWRSSEPNDRRTEDVILNEDFNTCPPISVQRRRRHGNQRWKRAWQEPVVASTNQLWPFSRISATVATLNSANVGYQSEVLDINTPEGRQYMIDIIRSLLQCCKHVISYTDRIMSFITYQSIDFAANQLEFAATVVDGVYEWPPMMLGVTWSN